MLNGWDMICLIWETAETTAERQAAVFEVAPMIPTLPGEVMGWIGDGPKPPVLEPACRLEHQNRDWRTGFVPGHTIARAERHRSLMT